MKKEEIARIYKEGKSDYILKKSGYIALYLCFGYFIGSTTVNFHRFFIEFVISILSIFPVTIVFSGLFYFKWKKIEKDYLKMKK